MSFPFSPVYVSESDLDSALGPYLKIADISAYNYIDNTELTSIFDIYVSTIPTASIQIIGGITIDGVIHNVDNDTLKIVEFLNRIIHRGRVDAVLRAGLVGGELVNDAAAGGIPQKGDVFISCSCGGYPVGCFNQSTFYCSYRNKI